jgi:hypothetical protein
MNEEAYLKIIKDTYVGVPYRMDVWCGTYWKAPKISLPEDPEEESDEDDLEEMEPQEDVFDYMERTLGYAYRELGYDDRQGSFCGHPAMRMGGYVWTEDDKGEPTRHIIQHDSGGAYGLDIPSYLFGDVFDKYITPLLLGGHLAGKWDITNIINVYSKSGKLLRGCGMGCIVDIFNRSIGGEVVQASTPENFIFHAQFYRFTLPVEFRSIWTALMNSILAK